MSVSCPIFGDKSYLVMAAESVFGVQDGTPSYVYYPVLSYGIENQPEMRQPQPYTGLAQRNDNIVVRAMTSGPITAALYGWHLSGAISLAEVMMTWAFTNLETLCSLPSKTLQWAEGPDVANKKHLGSTVNNATLAGSDENGGAITLSLDVMGSSEASLSTAQTIPSGLDRLNEFLFTDSTFSIGPNSGSLTEVEYKGFQWQQQRNLTPRWNGAKNPRGFRPGTPNANFQFNIEKADGTWDAIRRAVDKSDYYGRLVLKGAHNGTGGSGDYAQVQIDFPRLSFQSVKDAFVRNGPAQQTIAFQIQKPSSSGASTSLTWSEV